MKSDEVFFDRNLQKKPSSAHLIIWLIFLSVMKVQMSSGALHLSSAARISSQCWSSSTYVLDMMLAWTHISLRINNNRSSSRPWNVYKRKHFNSAILRHKDYQLFTVMVMKQMWQKLRRRYTDIKLSVSKSFLSWISVKNPKILIVVTTFI